ncbi:MAG: hypothetical protein WC997_15850 [Porticoccaceae bacterium]
MSKIKGERPTFRNTDMATLVRQADPKPAFYPTYIFSAKTFVKRDVPGKKPQQ